MLFSVLVANIHWKIHIWVYICWSWILLSWVAFVGITSYCLSSSCNCQCSVTTFILCILEWLVDFTMLLCCFCCLFCVYRDNLGYGSHQCRFLRFRVQRFLSSLADVFFTTKYSTHGGFLTFSESESESELIYDWRFIANCNLLNLTSNPLSRKNIYLLLQLNTCDHDLYVTPSLTRGWVLLLWIDLVFSSVRIAHIACYWWFFLFSLYKNPL
jgi:hypothetical protein